MDLGTNEGSLVADGCQVEIEMAQAELDVVKVLTGEDLETATEQRMMFPGNDDLFDEVEAYLRELRDSAASAAAQLPLPGVK